MKKNKLIVLVLAACVFFTACGASGTAPGLDSDVDYDLTQVNENVLFAQIGAMYGNPEDNIGKTVRVRGFFATIYDAASDTRKFVINIPDKNMCCQQTVEFIWAGEHEYPADYPAEGKQVEITACFAQYDDNGTTVYYMDTQSLERM